MGWMDRWRRRREIGTATPEQHQEREELVRHQQETAERMQHLQDLEREYELLRRRSQLKDDDRTGRYH